MNKEAADDTCPGTAVDCQFRILNCKYAELIRKAAFSMDNATQTRVDPDDDTNTSTYETIVSDITSNGGNYSEAVLEGSGFSLKRYDGKEAFEGVSADDAVQPDRYLYGSGSTGALYFSWDSLGIDSSVTTDSYEIAGDFTFREQSPAAIISTEATQLVKGADGKLRLELANGDEYQSVDSVITQNKKYRIQYQFGFDSVTMEKSSINVKGTTYDLDINTKVYVDGNYVYFIKVHDGKDTMSVFAGNGFYLGNKDESNRSIDYNVDNLAITRLPGSTKHTAACFAGEEKHAETTQNYYNGVSDKSITTTASEKVEKTFEYTGKIQSVKLQPGTYTLEAWGAQGGNFNYHSNAAPGKGGYSKGTITIDKETTLYIGVGGKGQDNVWHSGGGYNGGGAGAAPGGGATHIATADGTLSNLSSNKSSVILVAGGGAGSSGRCIGGAGGGANQNGTDGGAGCGGLGYGATLSTGGAPGSCGTAGSFGQGGSNTCSGGGTDSGSGAGGGYYGGGAGGHDHASPQSDDSSGGGGSGYADTSKLTSISGETGVREGNGLVKITGTTKAKTVKSIDWTGKHDNGENIQNGTNNTHTHTAKCLTADSEGLQIALDEASSGNSTDLEKMLGAEVWSKVKTQLKNCYGASESGNSDVAAGKVYTYDYTGSMKGITLPAGKYQLETWGAQGGDNKEYNLSGHNGGYAKGILELEDETTLYITVGGKGGDRTSRIDQFNGTNNNGGFNGGGSGTGSAGPGGGGATHIAKTPVVLASNGGTTSSISGLLVIAGGGGGGSNTSYNHEYGNYNYMNGQNGYTGYSGSYPYDNGGGGAGYKGGASISGDDPKMGHSGSSYVADSLKEASTANDKREGNGLAKITVLEAHTDYDPVKVYNVIKSIIGTDYSKIPTYVTTNGHTIVNPIWNCKNKFDGHKCTNKCETVANGNVSYELSCSEPHHTGNHYDVGNEICYDACHNDEAHKAANNKENATNTSGKALTMGDFILLDNYFQVYYPNLGDFYDTDHLGVLNTEQGRGHGYVNKMDTTEWTREKWIKFPYNVLYNRNGVWEEHQKDEWFQLEICKEDGKTPQDTYDFYCQLNNSEMSAGAVEFAVEAINNRESPYGSENPYGRDGSLSLDCAQSNDSMTNKDRSVDLTAKHSVYRQFFIDVVGRIGNLLLEDTGDMRFSNFFKKSLDEWDIDGIVHKVDQTVQNMYLSWHKNNGDTATDIRGEKVSPYNEWYNTYTTAKWTDKGNRADKVIPTPLAACKNKAQSQNLWDLGFLT